MINWERVKDTHPTIVTQGHASAKISSQKLTIRYSRFCPYELHPNIKPKSFEIPPRSLQKLVVDKVCLAGKAF